MTFHVKERHGEIMFLASTALHPVRPLAADVAAGLLDGQAKTRLAASLAALS